MKEKAKWSDRECPCALIWAGLPVSVRRPNNEVFGGQEVKGSLNAGPRPLPTPLSVHVKHRKMSYCLCWLFAGSGSHSQWLSPAPRLSLFIAQGVRVEERMLVNNRPGCVETAGWQRVCSEEMVWDLRSGQMCLQSLSEDYIFYMLVINQDLITVNWELLWKLPLFLNSTLPQCVEADTDCSLFI